MGRSRTNTLTDNTGSHKSRAPARAVYEIDWTKPESIDPDELVDFAVGNYVDGKTRRLSWEAEASEQLAWARGNQTLSWSDELRDMIQDDDIADIPVEFRKPIQINKLKGFVLQMMAMVLGKPIDWTVHPQTRDDDDVAAARICEKLLHYYWHAGSEDLQARVLDMVWMMYCTGVVWLKPIWDPAAGEMDMVDASVLERAGINAESDRQRGKMRRRFGRLLGKSDPKNPETIELPRGDMVLDFATGFDLTEPINCRCVQEAAWLIHSRFRSIEYVRDRYEAAKNLTPDSGTEAYNFRHFQQYGDSSFAYTGNETREIPDDEIMVHELWRPRSRSAPVGALVVVAGGEVLHQGPHPYIHGRLPFIALREMPEPEHFRPGCTIRDLMPLQRARNRQRSQINGHVETVVDPRILNQTGNSLADDAFVGGPKIIDVDDINAVKPWIPNPLPPHMMALDEQSVADMEDLAGVHRSTSGRSESSQQSGRHADLMRRSDNQRQTVTRQLLQSGFQLCAQQQLWLLWEHVSAERTTPIPGLNGEFDVVSWKGDALAPSHKPFGPWQWNIRAQIAPAHDEGADYKLFESYIKAGLLDPKIKSHWQLAMRVLGEHVATESDPWENHRVNAAEENQTIAGAAPVKTNLGDEDNIHLEAHNRYTTTAEYRRAVKAKPDVHLFMRVHIEEHMRQEAYKRNIGKAIEKKVQEDIIVEYGLRPRAPATPPSAGGNPGATQPGGPQPPPPGPPPAMPLPPNGSANRITTPPGVPAGVPRPVQQPSSVGA